jgi:hypothetical protein
VRTAGCTDVYPAETQTCEPDGATSSLEGLGDLKSNRFWSESGIRLFLVTLRTSTAGLKDNPFAAMAEQFGNLMLNAFKIKPGLGLYVLGASLGGAALIAKSGILTKFRVVRV